MKGFSVWLLPIVDVLTMVSAQNVNAQKLSKTPTENMYMKDKQMTPHAQSQPQEDAGTILSGKVVETMNSSGYTYVCLEKDGQKTWAAILETKVSVGQDMVLQPGYEMFNFSSKTLNRTFDKIIFSTGVATLDGVAGVKSGHGKSKSSQEAEGAPAEKIQVAKASSPNAYTVADVYGKRGELDKKSVVIKGKVVKVSSGIMGKNWLHIQDGTGSAGENNNDLVVTTKEMAVVGDVVTISGVVYKDKDFGSGYQYNVIVEDATISK